MFSMPTYEIILFWDKNCNQLNNNKKLSIWRLNYICNLRLKSEPPKNVWYSKRLFLWVTKSPIDRHVMKQRAKFPRCIKYSNWPPCWVPTWRQVWIHPTEQLFVFCVSLGLNEEKWSSEVRRLIIMKPYMLYIY